MLNYYGGKWNAGPWIIQNFPDHEIYVEVFGGGASVLLQKPRSRREVVNDLDEDVVNLYQVMRDQGDKLKNLCDMTPCARSEYKRSCRRSKDPVEQARRYIVRSYFGIGDSTQRNNSGMRTSKTSNTCVAKSWVSWNDQLQEIIDRFRGVMIENLPWELLVDKYDSPSTLFYFDPPYVLATRNEKHKYNFEFTNDDHVRFLKEMDNLKGYRIISGYNHEIYNAISHWKRIDREFKTGNNKVDKTESLWLCPRVAGAEKQLSLLGGE